MSTRKHDLEVTNSFHPQNWKCQKKTTHEYQTDMSMCDKWTGRNG